MHKGTGVWDSQPLAGEHSLPFYSAILVKVNVFLKKNDVLLKVVINYYQSLFQ